jgi:hypothetical protein
MTLRSGLPSVRRRRRRRLAAAAATALPAVARGHAPIEGMDGFWLGLSHPFAVPETAVLLVAAALALGPGAPAVLRPALGAWLAAIVGLFAAGLLGAPLPAATALPAPLLLVPALVLASLAALAPRVLVESVPRAGTLALGTAALLALAVRPEAGPASAEAMTLTGSAVALLATPLIALALFDAARVAGAPPVVGIGARVLAAWLAAATGLLLAFRLAA